MYDLPHTAESHRFPLVTRRSQPVTPVTAHSCALSRIRGSDSVSVDFDEPACLRSRSLTMPVPTIARCVSRALGPAFRPSYQHQAAIGIARQAEDQLPEPVCAVHRLA
jgi:hypothetical protein